MCKMVLPNQVCLPDAETLAVVEIQQDPVGPYLVQKPTRVPHFLFVEIKALVS